MLFKLRENHVHLYESPLGQLGEYTDHKFYDTDGSNH